MEPSIFAYIRKHSWRQQLVILLLTLLSFPPLYYSLDLQKTIVNRALSHPEERHEVLGTSSTSSTTCSCCAAPSWRWC